jgi:hypothetical protein
MRRSWSGAAALLGLAVLGGTGVCWGITRGAASHDAARAPVAEKLPDLTFGPSIARTITRLELTQPDPIDEEVPARSVTLQRGAVGRGAAANGTDGWAITTPIRTRASAAKVEALLENLAAIDVVERRDGGAAEIGDARLDAARAVHVVASSDAGPVRDLYLGKTDERGQWMRIAGDDHVFVVANTGPRGYSGFLYTRDLRSWREPAILAFDAAQAIEVEVVNAHGRFDFVRSGGGWTATRTPRLRDGRLGDPAAGWTAFDGGAVEALLRAYRGLAADDYDAAERRAQSGVDDAERSGGVVRVRFEDGERVVRVGKRSTRAGRWAIEGSRWAILEGGDGTLYVLAPWTADWATADSKDFEAGHHG